MPSSGGPPEVVTPVGPDGERPWHVDIMPDGEGAVFQTRPELLLRTLDIASGEVRDLIPGGFPRYAEGHLFFTSAEDGRTLMVVPFDPVTLQLEGVPIPVAEGSSPPHRIRSDVISVRIRAELYERARPPTRQRGASSFPGKNPHT